MSRFFIFSLILMMSFNAFSVGKTGRYKLHFENNTWWFLTPDGNKMISLGINHVEYEMMLGNYNLKNTLSLYGNDFVKTEGRKEFNSEGLAAKKWMSSVLKDFRNWNFNTMAYHTSVPEKLYKDSILYVKVLTPYVIENYYKFKIETPDVFSAEFRKKVNDYMKKNVGDVQDRKNILGYAFSDIPLYQKPASVNWVTAICNQSAETEGKIKWIKLLKAKYKNPSSVAKAYGISATTWNELADYTKWQFTSKDCKEDMTVFLSEITEEWVKTLTTSVKKHDKKGLIFGDKLDLDVWPDYFYNIITKYIDVVNVQFYGSLTDKKKQLLENIYTKTKKPIFIGDHAITMKSPNQESVKGQNDEGCNLSSRKEVGEATAQFIEQLMRLPFVVGWHICGYNEGWKGLENFWKARQCGLKDPFDNPFDETIIQIKNANLRVIEWHQKTAN